jgi:predicted metal-dependent phosphoesterase TrpH
MGYDLHIHSIYSDGVYRPAELIEKAIFRGVTGIALTDHDTVAGIGEAMMEAVSRGFELIPGVELTTDYGPTEVHILGYDFDLQAPKLLRKLDSIVEGRNERARSIIKKLNKHGIPLTWEKVRAKTTSKFVGRAHIFKAMEAERMFHPEHRQDAFEYYLGRNGLAYEPHREISTFEAVELIAAAGGIPVLAHPGRMENDRLIHELCEAGLKGLEVYYPSHTPDLVTRYLGIAEHHHLYITGGTDFHNSLNQIRIGDYQAKEIEWRGKEKGEV